MLVGTVTGEVKALSLDEKDPVFTLESPQVCMASKTSYMNSFLEYLNFLQNSSAATSIACSKDGKFLAVGHENGKLQLWKGIHFHYYAKQWYVFYSHCFL